MHIRQYYLFLSLFGFLGFLGGLLLPLQSIAQTSLEEQVEQKAKAFSEQVQISETDLQETIDLITKEAKSLTGRALKSAILLLKWKDEAAMKKRELRRLSTDIVETKTKLQEIYEKTASLRGELAAIGRTMHLTQAKLRSIRVRLAEAEQNLTETTRSLAEKKQALAQEKARMTAFLRLLYLHKLAYASGGSLQANVFNILLADATTSDVTGRAQALRAMEGISETLFQKLVQMQAALEIDAQRVGDQRSRLDLLHTEFLNEERDLKTQEEAKKKLILLTKGEERLFQELLIQSQREQAEVILELENLRANISFINEKLSTVKEHFDPEEFAKKIEARAQAARELGLAVDLERLATVTALEWPVLPKQGLSAYFRDPSYQRFFGIRHNAIDIPTVQGTPIHAPAPGLVYRVRDNGDGYNFMILAHPGGLQTVYGHVSDFSVREGEFVTQGQIIGYTGGIPGSKGAGWLTTGPHLHFEVLANGQWMDPLTYLPLELLPKEHVSEILQNTALQNSN